MKTHNSPLYENSNNKDKIKDSKNIKDSTASGRKVSRQGQRLPNHSTLLRCSSSNEENNSYKPTPPILDCKYARRCNQYYHICDHRDNLDYRQRKFLRRPRIKKRRCMKQFCPLLPKKGTAKCNHCKKTR